MSEPLELIAQHIDPGYYGGDDIHFESAEVAANHYLKIGSSQGLDPAHWFDTSYYLLSNPDVAAAGINPFFHFLLHGRSESRAPLPGLMGLKHEIDYHRLSEELTAAARTESAPALKALFRRELFGGNLVSVIVPNFNHAEFLTERLDSIVHQTYSNIELIVLDDASTDHSRELIEDYLAKVDLPATFHCNDANSGNVFRQWRKGWELAKGELVWICESDDSAELDFVELLAAQFMDPTVRLAAGRTVFVDQSGREFPGLDQFRDHAEPGFFDKEHRRPAGAWFKRPFSVKNVIANVGGALVRKQAVEDAVWGRASEFEVLGDWYLYLQWAGTGRIAWNPKAVTYFRQHGANTSVSRFAQQSYYDEHNELAKEIRKRWKVPSETTTRFFLQLADQFENLEMEGELVDHVSVDELLRLRPESPHVLVGFFGFSVGGGEYFPIHLANAFLQSGVRVSMLSLANKDAEPRMRDLLNPAIPVYTEADVSRVGADSFIKDVAPDVISSHHIGVEKLLMADNDFDDSVPLVASLHGTYDLEETSEHLKTQMTRRVAAWIPTTDRNLTHLNARPWADSLVQKIPNSVPLVGEPWDHSRESLGIPDSATVFALIARSIPEKGWAEAIEAVHRLNSEAQESAVLLLVGQGLEQERLEREWPNDPSLRFLGFQPNAEGILGMADVCLLPTRFEGESYPLILVQAMLTGTAIVSADAGEIMEMVVEGDRPAAGLVIARSDEDAPFVADLTAAMKLMCDPDSRAAFALGASDRANDHSMDVLVDRYLRVFAAAIQGSQEIAP